LCGREWQRRGQHDRLRGASTLIEHRR
jgi:hypothetical protein